MVFVLNGVSLGGGGEDIVENEGTFEAFPSLFLMTPGL